MFTRPTSEQPAIRTVTAAATVSTHPDPRPPPGQWETSRYRLMPRQQCRATATRWTGDRPASKPTRWSATARPCPPPHRPRSRRHLAISPHH